MFKYLACYSVSRATLAESALWSVGDGRSVSIWSDPWIPTFQGFKSSMPSQMPADISRVSYLMIHSEGKWNEQLIHQLFSPFEAAHFLRIVIYKNPAPDKLTWTLTTHGEFTSKSYQKLLASDAGETSHFNDPSFPWVKFRKKKKN